MLPRALTEKKTMTTQVQSSLLKIKFQKSVEIISKLFFQMSRGNKPVKQQAVLKHDYYRDDRQLVAGIPISTVNIICRAFIFVVSHLICTDSWHYFCTSALKQPINDVTEPIVDWLIKKETSSPELIYHRPFVRAVVSWNPGH